MEQEVIKKFDKFFADLGELCFKIKMVERPAKPSIEVNETYPGAIKSFHMAMGRSQCDGIKCLLQKNGEVIVEFISGDTLEVEKVVTYASITEICEKQIGLIHFLTRAWKPF